MRIGPLHPRLLGLAAGRPAHQRLGLPHVQTTLDHDPGQLLRPRLADQRLWYLALGTVAVLFTVVRNLVPLS